MLMVMVIVMWAVGCDVGFPCEVKEVLNGSCGAYDIVSTIQRIL